MGKIFETYITFSTKRAPAWVSSFFRVFQYHGRKQIEQILTIILNCCRISSINFHLTMAQHISTSVFYTFSRNTVPRSTLDRAAVKASKSTTLTTCSKAYPSYPVEAWDQWLGSMGCFTNKCVYKHQNANMLLSSLLLVTQ